MTATIQVFMSHAASHDGPLAHRIAGDLERMRVPVWIAPDSIKPGETWAEAIDRGLLESSHLVIVLTPAAMVSGWVRKEIAAGMILERRQRIELIPLDVEPCDLVNISPTLATYQMINFRQTYDAAVRELAGKILGHRVTAPGRAAPAPPRPVARPSHPKATAAAASGNLVAQVKEILADCAGIDPSMIRESSDLVANLQMDELDLVEFIMAAEERFGIEIPDADVYDASMVFSTDGLRLRSVRDVVNYLARRVSSPQGQPAMATPAPRLAGTPGKLRCSLCGLPFNRESDLQAHISNWHGRTSPGGGVRAQPAIPARATGRSTSTAAFVCAKCGLGFNRQSDLDTHWSNWHSGKR